MDKETAKAIRQWIKACKRDLTGDRSEWARGARSSLSSFETIVSAAAKGDLDLIRKAADGQLP